MFNILRYGNFNAACMQSGMTLLEGKTEANALPVLFAYKKVDAGY